MKPTVVCLILAGGQGSRLFPLTEKRAKPAVRFGGGYRLIDIPISNALNSDIKEIYIYTQYCPKQLKRHVERSFPPERIEPAEIELLSPEVRSDGAIDLFLGTADAVRKSLNRLSNLDAEYFLILSGDQLYTMDLSEMLTTARETDADMVIATLPIGRQEVSRFGIMQINQEKKIVDFVEKSSDEATLARFELPSGHFLASMGIYLFKKEALFSLLSKKGDDFGKDLIPLVIQEGRSFAYVYDGYWEDIGTISSYYHANLALLAQTNCLDTTDERFPIYSTLHDLPSPRICQSMVKHSLLSHGVVIEGKEISSSVIGLNTHIQEGTVVENSIVLGGDIDPEEKTIVGKNCHLKNVIIDENCIIGDNVKLINKNNLDHYDGPGIYIRNKIMIVASGTQLPDGFEL